MTSEQVEEPARPRVTRTRALIEIGLVVGAFFAARYGAVYAGFDFAGPVGVVAAVIVATVLLYAGGSNWGQAGLRLPASWRGWLAWPLLTVLAMAGTIVAALILMPQIAALLPETMSPQRGLDAFAFLIGNPIPFALFMIFVVWGTAAFGEEMMFRGFLQGRLEALVGSGLGAVAFGLVAQAVLFGLLHGYQGVFGIIQTGMIALVMGTVYLLGRRWLLPVILAHGLIDTISLVQLYNSGG